VAQILWIASFPKSGNTWLRALLANYLTDSRTPVDINTLPSFAYGDMRAEPYERIAGQPVSGLPPAEINRLRPAVHRALAESAPEIVFVKTHSILAAIDDVPTITPEVTFGALYVVRNPLDVAVSFADHYGLTMEQGVRAVCFANLEIPAKAGHVLQVIGDWSSHVRSWLTAPGLYRHVVRYEDLLRSPQTTFGQVLSFLKLKKDRDRLRRAIRHSAFEVLAGQEAATGFVERSRHAERFFRSGRAGSYAAHLSPEEIAAMVECHRPMMQQLGYLTPSGEPAF
jgi:hypothetical protein